MKYLFMLVFLFGCNAPSGSPVPSQSKPGVTQNKLSMDLYKHKNKTVSELAIGEKGWTVKSSVWVEDDGSCFVRPDCGLWSMTRPRTFDDYVVITRDGDELSMEVYGKNKFISGYGHLGCVPIQRITYGK